MRKIFIVACSLVYILSSCSKTDITSSDGPIAVTPTPIAPILGIIKPSATDLVLHVNDQATLSAKVFNEHGDLLPVQPAITFSSSDDAVLVSSTGVVSGTSEGNAVITVSDGIHAKAYINVSVVPNSVSIPSGPANINFNTSAISIEPGGNLSIPSYTLTDLRGNVVSGSLTFETQDASKATVISNNTIEGIGTGGTMLLARFNGIILNGGIPLFIQNNSSSTPIVSFQVMKFPSVFNYYNETAPHIQLKVTESWTNSSGVHFNFYETTPDRIEVEHGNILGITLDGRLVSKYPGITKVKVGYKGVDAVIFSGVHMDLTGIWSGGQGGTNYSICVRRGRTPIVFNVPNYSNTSQELITAMVPYNLNLERITGSASISNQTNDDQYYLNRVSMQFPHNSLSNGIGPINTMDATIGQVWIVPGGPISFIAKWQNNINSIKLEGGPVLSRSGNCDGDATGSGLSLAQVLTSGGTNTWNANACLFGDFDIETITFRSNNTGTVVDDTGEPFDFTWSVYGNEYVKFNDDPGYAKWFVASYSPTSVNIFRIYEYDPTQTPDYQHDNYYSGQGGCIFGLRH